ncbi:hypothetical protein CHCC14820_1358 [Bacillus paralicheniformis]|uniref:Uncharacterized protein n=1 Tax=Bacillus paralicheniformis TaxID=1648923 RepID=A0A6I7TXS7_9BACI|nr:hypothetical protein LI7559_13395 [Bacillus licheniformis LMG 7559]KUL15707.1 hypothetical protein LI6934_18990 [Bacillus licheniformis LMG 6934]OLF90928.1 hypothetical protein B4121_3141 [Bacillus paralicheniformis]TWJ39884.1 hypothetical protein CHCC5027_1465 [Bacillus paralicheniformis]TWJ48552.1 hypothetical protein CHCC5023_3535 [Bacillus paralicheniformis]
MKDLKFAGGNLPITRFLPVFLYTVRKSRLLEAPLGYLKSRS